MARTHLDGEEPASDIESCRPPESFHPAEIEMTGRCLSDDTCSEECDNVQYRTCSENERQGNPEMKTHSIEISKREAPNDLGNDNGIKDKVEDVAGRTEEDGVRDECEEDMSGVPIDRGWAWFVLLGCFLNIMLFVGYVKSLSILFVEYLRIFEASTTATTLVMGVVAAVFSISSVFSSHFVLERLGVRKTAFLGSFINTVAMATAVFAPNIIFLICVHCVLTGIGNSMMLAPGLVSVGRYFKKRRGMAMAIAMSSTSISSGVFPMITRLILDEYGIRGTMLIFTGITLNMFVASSLLRPIEFYTKRKQTANKVDGSDVRESNQSEKVNGADVKGNNLLRNIATANSGPKTFDIAKRVDDVNSNIQDYDWLKVLSTSAPNERQFSSLNLLPITRNRTYSDCSKRSYVEKFSHSEKSLYSSNLDFLSVSIKDITQDNPQRESSQLSINSTPKKSKWSCNILDLSLFKMPMFQLYTANAFLAILVNIIPNYLPALANEKGIEKTEAALLLLIMGSLDFFMRLGLGVFVDLKLLKVKTVIAIGLVCSGTLCQFTSFYNTYPLLIMFAVLNGVVGSTYHCLMPVLIVDFMGVELLGKAIGFSSMYHGMSVAITHPIIGAIKDLSGTFTYSYNYVGVGAYVSALLLLLAEPLCRRRHVDREARENCVESETPLTNKSDG